MAKKPLYNVHVSKPNWGTIHKAKTVKECWGGESRLNDREWLITHHSLCNGNINPGELYLRRKDRRDPTAFWKVSIYCAVNFHSENLSGELHGFTAEASEAEVGYARRETAKRLLELEKMCEEAPPWMNLQDVYQEIKKMRGGSFSKSMRCQSA